jgi:hypothetical protein
VSGAIWSEAKKHSQFWRRIWPRWQRANKPLPTRGAGVTSPLVLVGSYGHADGLNRAEEEFAKAHFDSAVFVRACETIETGLWSRIVDCLRRPSKNEAAYQPQVPFVIKGAEEVLIAGGGFVLVQCAARFHQACEIIERTGGRVGITRQFERQ